VYVERWIVLISGFTQGEGRARGMDALWLALRECSGPRTVVELLTWRHNMRDYAERLWRMRPPNGRSVDVRVAAYSWGAGHGFLSLARQLDRRGIGVSRAVLCDPVYHSVFAPWRAIISPFVEPTIVVPDNVSHVWTMRQTQNRPHGHRVVAADPAATAVEAPVALNCDHEYADDASAFHKLATEVLCPHRGR
jgi:hypothetical protein